MVKVKMAENLPNPKTTRAQAASSSEVTEHKSGSITQSEEAISEMLATIKTEIKETGQMDSAPAIRVMFLHLFSPNSPVNLQTMMMKITALEEKVEQKEIKIKELSSKIKEMENVRNKSKNDMKKQIESLSFESHKTKVTLANIPLSLSNPNDTTESPENTTKAVEEILKLSGQSINSVKEFNRIYPKETKPKPKDPKIFLDFMNVRELRKFTQKIKEIRAQEKYQTLVLDNVCPPHLLQDYLKANEKGFLLRTSQILVTRTFIKANGIVLKAKKPGT